MKSMKNTRSIKQITQAKEYDRHQVLHSLLVRYEQKIENYTMNELIKERENSNSLSPEESQIVMMPWLKEHIDG